MSFDELVNVKMTEVEIFDRVADILQKNFHKYQDVNVVLPLNEMVGELCSIKEVRLYSRHDAEQVEAKREYMMGGEYDKAYLISTYYDGYYQFSLFGHFATKHADVYNHKIEAAAAVFWDVDRTTQKAIPRDILEGAFGEFKATLSKKMSA